MQSVLISGAVLLSVSGLGLVILAQISRSLPPALAALHSGGRSPPWAGSEASGKRHVAPLLYPNAERCEEAWQRLLALIDSNPRLRLQSQDAEHLHATAHTPLFGFVDDLEAWKRAGTTEIHLRSASRIGGSDFGANVRRLQALRAQLLAGDG